MPDSSSTESSEGISELSGCGRGPGLFRRLGGQRQARLHTSVVLIRW